MPIRSIVTDRRELSKPCEKVLDGEDISQIIQDLKDTFTPLKGRGFGLAANQIGYNKAIAYIIFAGQEYIIINPVKLEAKMPIPFKEGCFSFSGLEIKTSRYNYFKIKHGLGEGKEEEFKGLLGIVMQHEVDHLNGITLFQRRWRAK
jgi:peptide deformylase